MQSEQTVVSVGDVLRSLVLVGALVGCAETQTEVARPPESEPAQQPEESAWIRPQDWPSDCPEPANTEAERAYRDMCDRLMAERLRQRLVAEQGAGAFKAVDVLPYAREHCEAVQCPPLKALGRCEIDGHPVHQGIPEDVITQVVIEKCVERSGAEHQ